MNEKQAFSLRLKKELEKHEWPTNSPTWLAREFNIRYSGNSISVQTANNWLSGTVIPNQDKLQVLAAWLDISTQWLRFGEKEHTLENNLDVHQNIQLYLTDLPEKISKLSPKQKSLVYELVDALLAKNE
ncbi:hypothetical protein [Acinetobacter pittii]|uniref:hypothetical protein n=1 Tax=Acinetobacter pittii TaxID=48296 RepID=UPI002380464B|nr:hypothetical protein [Acinetobacter pittii]MDE4038311.1 hypothetical protein [Acinetobacter pittii]WPP88976.1 hypothetical protein SOI77_02795 [Acinetobacter pittii]